MEERVDISNQLGLKVGEDGKTLVESVCGQSFFFEMEIVDLNHDGKLEVFVLGGNTCLSGLAGSSVWLFVKDESGKYNANLGFPAGGYNVLDSLNAGFPDLRFGGPGFCEPVWRWNGKTYEYFRSIATAEGGCDNR